MKQLITYFVLAYLISWIIWFPLYGHIFGFTNLPTIPFNHAFGALGPLIASFLTTWIFFKAEGVKTLLAKCFQLKPFLYLAIALLGPFVLALVASMASHFINNTSIDLSRLFKTTEFPQSGFLTFFIYNILFFGFGEEVGWRGFALPRFQQKFNSLTSSIMVTLFWAIWHWPLFFYRSGFMSMEIGGVFGWLFSLLTGSVLLTWLFNSSKASILICAVFHSTIDIAFTADFANKDMMNYMGFLIAAWGTLTIIIFKSKSLAMAITPVKQ